jgi:hypothetical protein
MPNREYFSIFPFMQTLPSCLPHIPERTCYHQDIDLFDDLVFIHPPLHLHDNRPIFLLTRQYQPRGTTIARVVSTCSLALETPDTCCYIQQQAIFSPSTPQPHHLTRTTSVTRTDRIRQPLKLDLNIPHITPHRHQYEQLSQHTRHQHEHPTRSNQGGAMHHTRLLPVLRY